jgi:hypothetical protein
MLLLPAGVFVLGLAGYLLWPRTAINRENFTRLRPGMTPAEVEAILGGPARYEASGVWVPDLHDGPAATDDGATGQRFLELQATAVADRAASSRRWTSDELLIWVTFDAQGRAQSCDAFPVRRVREPVMDRLRRWLGFRPGSAP